MRIPRLAAISATLLLVISMASGQQPPSAPKAPARPGLTLTTTAFQDGGIVPEKYTQSGPNFVSPPLEWTNVPPNTQTFALIVHDLDVARQKSTADVLHWIIFNIPADTTSLPAGAGKPEGGGAPQGSIQSMTDFGQPGYGGPCPPPGHKPHRYIFTVYALKTDQIPLQKEASGAMAGFYLNQNVLKKASFTAKYGRK